MPAFVDPYACLVPVPACRQEQSAKPVNALPASRLEAQANNLLKVMARHGTGSIGGLSGFGCDDTGELKILRAMRARNGRPLDIVSIFLVRQSNGNGANRELLQTVAKRQLAGIAAVRCGGGAVGWESAEPFLWQARSLGLQLQMEVLPDRDPHAVAGALNLRVLSIASAGPLARMEIEEIAASETVAVLFPNSRGLTSEDARRLIAGNGLVALASGLDPHNGSTASMQTVIQHALEVFGLSIEEAISAATVNAASALGIGERAGALEYRKQADLVLLNVSDYREIPLFGGTNLVHSLMKRGEIIFEDDFPGWPARD
jgi:imidazolonepropionase